MSPLRAISGKVLSLAAFLLLELLVLAESPFQGTLECIRREDGALEVTARISGPPGGRLDAAMLELAVTGEGEVVRVDDATVDAEGYYPAGSVFRWRVSPAVSPENLELRFQGCTSDMCYMPQAVAGSQDGPPSAEAGMTSGNFRVSEALSGYADAGNFLEWMERARLEDGIENASGNLLERTFRKHGWILAMALVVGLGILLNLTPCVLPMIPITLGVLGAKGAGAGRMQGALLGGIYGSAMAFTYGATGAAVVFFGVRMGLLQASASFQFLLAAVLTVLGLSLFDFYFLDLSRFVHRGALRTGRYLAAALLGGMAALMAGACVAPVLVWVLLLSARLYAEGGRLLVLWLPLCLGVGLGLPWPFLGAGLGGLPRPGRWMTVVKKGFGVLILLYAGQVAWDGVCLARHTEKESGIWQTDYHAALAMAEEDGRPVLLEFRSRVCRACQKMERTTFRDSRVRDILQSVHCVTIQGEEAEGRILSEEYGVPGFPTFILLTPHASAETGAGQP